MDRMLAQSFLLDYMCSAMSIYMPLQSSTGTSAASAAPSGLAALPAPGDEHAVDGADQTTGAAGQPAGEEDSSAQVAMDEDAAEHQGPNVAASETETQPSSSQHNGSTEQAALSDAALAKNARRKLQKATKRALKKVAGGAARTPAQQPSDGPARTASPAASEHAVEEAVHVGDHAAHDESMEDLVVVEEGESASLDPKPAKRSKQAANASPSQKKSRLSLGAKQAPRTPTPAQAPSKAATTGKKKRKAATNE
jgi:hypothetical protein